MRKYDYLYFLWQDDSRELASILFPSLSSLLKRKKDHGKYTLLPCGLFASRSMKSLDEIAFLLQLWDLELNDYVNLLEGVHCKNLSCSKWKIGSEQETVICCMPQTTALD